MKIALMLAVAVVSLVTSAEVVIENSRLKLTVGDDAVVKSLVVKASGEEMLVADAAVPMVTVTQERFFHNEIKLAYPSGEVTCRANRVTREGDLLRVGFELLPYDAIIRIRERAECIGFELVRFDIHGKAYANYKTKMPAVKALRILQLPVKTRCNFGEWLNVMWDERSAVAVIAPNPFMKIGAEECRGYRLFAADLDRDLKLEGGEAVLIAAAGKDDFLACLDAMETAYELPRGVCDRQNDVFNSSVFWTADVTPENVENQIAFAKRGGFRMMLIYHTAICVAPGDYIKGNIGDYEMRPEYPKGLESLKEMLTKIRAAGIHPGIHLLHPFIGFNSKKYVTPIADHRLHLKKHFTVARDAGIDGGELYVEEDPSSCPLVKEARILRFEGELLSYEGFTTSRPYKFTGVKRGAKDTRVAALPKGRIGGLLDVAEDGGNSCYIDQDSSLQDELCDRFAEFWRCGFEFLCLDGCEGVNAPCQTHVANGQYRLWKKLEPKPLFTEGAAKAHFAWHHLSGANAFDTFSPEIFKEMIVKWPLHEAEMMRREFSRVSFGWWGIWLPGDKLSGGGRSKAGVTVGTQPDMWEFGTSRAAAWDCPTTIQFSWDNLVRAKKHPRMDDLLEVMRRWEDVRARKWLTDAQKESLKSATRQHHLYLNDRGEYELHEIELLVPEDAAGLRAFVFEREGKRVIAYWHTSGTGDFVLPLGANGAEVTLHAAGLKYYETELPREAVKRAFVPRTTAGWENISKSRAPFPMNGVMWKADCSKPSDFTWEVREGATGSVEITADGIFIRKTNDLGYIVVKGKSFAVKPGQKVRCLADQESADADVNYSSGVVRGHGREEDLSMDRASDHLNFWDGGVQTMRGFPCTPPGIPYRKYGDFKTKDDVFTPVILVSGRRSTSRWTNWAVEDFVASDKAWQATRKYDYQPPTNRMDAAEFRRFIAGDTVHTAEVRRVDGVSRVMVDGEISASAAFHSYHVNPDKQYAASFAGRALDGSAVKLMVKQIIPCRACDERGENTDYEILVDELEDAMRAAPNSLFIISFCADVPKPFVETYHPEEAWTRENGEMLYGVYGSCIIGYLGSKKSDFKNSAYVWPSYASTVWREWVKRQIRGFLAAAKARGLDKRIVGIHPFGFHDGQFSAPYTDYSKPAREAYARMIVEPDCLSTNYAFCMKQLGVRAQNEFAREFKRVLGKPTIGVRWCESPFMSWRTMALDITTTCRSEALDVIVCQPDYRERQPAFPSVQLLPVDSLHLHGKTFWNEIDYRTYTRQEGRERNGNSPASAMAMGRAADIEMWRTMYRKVIGEADAARTGHWLYDILGGAFDAPEMTADIRELAAESEMLARRVPSKWRADVAFVVDEAQILQSVPNALECVTGAEDFIYPYCCRLWGTSGVPHRRYLMDDVLKHEELLGDCRLVVFASMRRIDEARAALVNRLTEQGATIVYLSETGLEGGAAITGFKPMLEDASRRSLEVVAEPGVTDNMLNLRDIYNFRDFNAHLRVPHRCTVAEEPGVKVLARYADDGKPAVVERRDGGARRVYVAASGAFSSEYLNRLAREAGAYTVVDRMGLQVDMSGDFMSIHCLRPGSYDIRLPFAAKVINLKSKQPETVDGRVFKVNLTAGETCRFLLERN